MGDIEGKFIKFVEGKPKAKTKIWDVLTKEDGDFLGSIAWFGCWRKYCFFPGDTTVFEQTCLRDIASFCEQRTVEHRSIPPHA